MRQKLLSLITSMALLMSLLGAMPITAGAEDITTISTLAELEAFRDSVNSGNTYEGVTVTLTSDIDAGGIDFWGDRVKTKKWTPIGNYADGGKYFEGVFDGNGHTINGIYINSTQDYQGLFGCNRGTVKNLHIDGEIISTGNFVGGIAGMNGGTIENCYNTGSTKNRDENGTSAEPYGSYIGGIAGIVNNGGTIKNCYTTGRVGDPGFPQSVSGLGDNIGGIAGAVADGTIENCYETGYSRAGEFGAQTSVRGANNVGGIVGSASESSVIQGCFYLEKTVIIGMIAQSADGGNSIAVTKAQMRDLQTFANWDFDNVWEMNPLLCRPVLKALAEHTVQGSGSEQDPYLIPDLKTLDVFRDYINMDYNLGESEYFKLTNNIDMSVKYGTKTPVANEAYGIDAGRSWISAGFRESVPFKGTFDGDGHSLTGFYINKAAEINQGLFGFNEGVIKNLDIKGFLVGASYSGTVAGVNQANGIIDNCHAAANINILPDYKPSSERLGGISGQNDGKILNSTHSGNILTASIAGGIAGLGTGTIEGCSHTGNVEVIGSSARRDYAGGIAGYITDGGSIKDCQNSGNVNLKYNSSSSGSNYSDYAGGIVGYIEGGIENSYNTGNVEYGAIVGGIAGYVNGTVKNCHSSYGDIKSNGYIIGGIAGQVADGKIEKCYNTSVLSSGTHDGNGGIVGRLEKGEVVNCLSTGYISGDENVGGVVGYALGGAVKSCCFYKRDGINANKSRAIIGLNNENSATAENCYCYGASDSIDGAVKKSFDEFKNGSVAYLLNGGTSEGELNWYQNIGTDMYPVLDNTHSVVRYDGEQYYNGEPTQTHTHTLVHHAAVAVTDTEAGTGEYWKCEGDNGCNKMFSDANGTAEITEIPIIPATGIKYDYSIRYENGKAVATVPQDGTYTVIFAAYDNGRLLSVNAQNIPLVKGENSPISPQSFNANGANTVKVVIWDSLMGMKPLAKTELQ